ncbi:RSP_2648 family PIN domain-containing protein [Paracoccus albus]|uniref:RSP_2648 family PIN domain-containing protein n=1 Tax=Paracoccus albus TaxID=3017784 RepID=UPI0022F01E78|nr:PIN domain-containing protein [Paracoccus albus]WBU59327.1 PIN domain-containing protein [Paracoccus albus]
MIAVLDANVLFPTVLREILSDVAAAGLFRPVWSERILKEWTYSAAKLSPVAADIAGAEASLLRERFPDATTDGNEAAAQGFDLPDPADLHVLAAAVERHADLIVTMNLRDFPRGTMLAAGTKAIHPDAFLTDLWAHHPDPVAAAAHSAHEKANQLGAEIELRALMKRARLPRLGRALTR